MERLGVNEFFDLDGDKQLTVVCESNGCPVAHMYELKGAKDFARIFAAAPDLLKAAEEIVSIIVGAGFKKRKPDSDGYYSEPIHKEELDALVAAIAKATGETA